MGTPPPIDLARQNRSGLTPNHSVAPPYAITTPVLTSSKMSTAPCCRGQFADALQEAGEWRHDADVELHRLDDDRRDLALVALEDRCQRLGVVERRDDRFLNARSRQAGRCRHGRRRVESGR